MAGEFIWAASINQPKKWVPKDKNDQGTRGSLPCSKCGGKDKHYMLGVSPCPDGGCKNCGAISGHYYTCPDNPSFERRARVEVSKEDIDAASRIETAQRRMASLMHSETIH